MSSTNSPTALDDAPSLAARRLDDLADRVARSSSADADGDADGPAAGTDAIDVFAPATTERIGSVPACEASDVDAAVERAREAQAEWAAATPARRAAVLDRFGDLVLDDHAELLDLQLQLETGKSRRTAVEELFDVPMGCGYLARQRPASSPTSGARASHRDDHCDRHLRSGRRRRRDLAVELPADAVDGGRAPRAGRGQRGRA